MDTTNKKRMEKRNEAFMENPGTTKRSLDEPSRDKKIIKQLKISTCPLEEKTVQKVKERCVEIASLKITSSSPPIEGTLAHVSIWRNVSKNSRYAHFVLEDASGQIKGVIYRENNPSFEKNFAIGARMTVKNAKIREIKENFRGSSSLPYELVVHQSVRTVELIRPPVNKPTFTMDKRMLIRDIVERSRARELVDVIGILEKVHELFFTPDNSTMKRDLQIIDESSILMTVTIWHDTAKNFNTPTGSVLAMSQVAVRVYNNTKGLTFSQNTRLDIDPPIEVTERLKNWYSQYNSNEKSRVYKYSTNVLANDTTMCVKTNNDDKKVLPSNYVHNRYIPIKDIHGNISVGETIDTIGVVLEILETEQVTTKRGQSKKITTVLISDDNRAQIKVAIWSDESDKLNIPIHSIIAANRAKVREFDNEKKLDCFKAKIEINPDIPDVDRLKRILPTCHLLGIEQDEERTNEECAIENAQIDGSMEFPEHSFTKINIVNEESMVGEFIDVLGVIQWVLDDEFSQDGEKETIMMKLIDKSGGTIWIMFSGENAKNFDGHEHLIVALKNVKLCFSRGRKVLKYVNEISSIIIEPCINEVIELREWYGYSGEAQNWLKRKYGNSYRRMKDDPSESRKSKTADKPHQSSKRPFDDSSNSIESFDHNFKEWPIWIHELLNELHDKSSEKSQRSDHLPPEESEWYGGNCHESQRSCVDNTRKLPESPPYDESWVPDVFTDEIIPIHPLTPFDQLTGGRITSVLGIITRISGLKSVSRSSNIKSARVLEILDQSEIKIALFLWNEAARDFDIPEGTAIVAINVNVCSIDDEKICRSMPFSVLKTDVPKFHDDIERLKKWYAAYKSSVNPEKSKSAHHDEIEQEAPRPDTLEQYD